MTIKQIDQLIDEGQALNQLAEAYAEIANLKIKKIRTEAERNKLFLKEISGVYNLVKKMALKKGVNFLKPKKMVSIVVTSNSPFYGTTNYDLLDFFIMQTQKLTTDKIILGKVGVDYFRIEPIFKNFQEVVLASDQPNLKELATLVNLIEDYSQVLVFYSGFKSLLVQQPSVIAVRGSNSLTGDSLTGNDKVPDDEFVFIFEPDLSRILSFFDTQIATLLLEGIFLESELSRAASRFISMDQAQTEANKFIKENQKLKAYTIRNINNNAILESFASMMAERRLQHDQ